MRIIKGCWTKASHPFIFVDESPEYTHFPPHCEKSLLLGGELILGGDWEENLFRKEPPTIFMRFLFYSFIRIFTT